MDERTALISLAALLEPGTAGIAEAVAERGPLEVLERALRAGSAMKASGVAGRLNPDQVPRMLDDQTARGVRVLVQSDDEYPSQLLDLAEPPLALWVRGPLDLRAAALRSVAVVGARACTPYGERATSHVVSGLAAAEWAIVSGAAFGVDAAAHRAALAEGGATIAVLACGVDITYPRAHDHLLGQIANEGVIVSELPPGSQPLKFRFLARNRVIAALTRGTLIVEAARRSGAISTANRAMELGRVVMAVPGPITSMASAGSNRLLFEQAARAAASADDVTALLLGVGPGRALEQPVALTNDLPPHLQRVLDALRVRRPLTVSQVAAASGLGDVEALASLGVLELQGAAVRSAGGWRRSS